MNLDGFFFTNLIQQVSADLSGSRVENIYQTAQDNFVIQLRAPGQTLHLEISVLNPPFAFFISNEAKRTNELDPLTQVLKNHLNGCFCLGITNSPFDRMGTLAFAPTPSGTPQFLVHIELMGRQNDLTLCQQQTIIASTRRNKSGQRPLLPGDQFTPPPPANKIPPHQISEAVLRPLLTNIGPIAVKKALVRGVMGVSPRLAEEICHRAGIESQVLAAEIQQHQINNLIQQINQLAELCLQGNAQPVVYQHQHQALGPYWLKLQHINTDGDEYATLSQALEYWSHNARRGQRFVTLDKHLQSTLDRVQAKSQRTLRKQQKELDRAQNYNQYRELGDTLLAYIHAIPPRQSSTTLNNVHTGEQVTLDLDPTMSASANAARYYKLYSKFKNAQSKVTKQIINTKRELDYLKSLDYALQIANDLDDLEEIQAEMQEQGFLRQQKTKKKTRRRQEFLTYLTPAGTRVLVGKNNRQNELLTLRKADKSHYWFHSRHFAGSHVILTSHNPQPEEIEFAAALAAWHSKAQTSPKVEVVWTQVKNVKKIPGSKPGMVRYTEYNSVFIEPAGGESAED